MNLKMFNAFGKIMIFIMCISDSRQLPAQWFYQTPQSNHKVWVQDNLILDENTVWMGANEFLWDTTINNWNYGQAAYFYHTSDGGVNWISGKFDIEPDRYPYISSIASSGSTTGWASIYGVADGTNTVFKTIDNGHNWTQAANTIYTDPSSYINAITFKDSMNGLMIGDPTPLDSNSTNLFFEIYQTIDGGQTWSRVPRSQIPEPLTDEYGITDEYCRIDDHIWFITNQGRLFSSVDGGLNWTAKVVGPGNLGIFRYVDLLHGIMYAEDPGNTGRLIYTSDGGLNWIDVTPSIVIKDHYYWSICLIPESYYIFINISESSEGGPFKSYISKDLGKTWIQVGQDEGLSFARFISPAVGYSGEGLMRNQDHPTRIYKYAGNPLTGIFTTKKLNAEILVYPNPVLDKLSLNIRLDKSAPLLINCNSADGKLIWSKKVSNHSDVIQEEFTIKFIASGVYTLTICTPDASVSKTFTKK